MKPEELEALIEKYFRIYDKTKNLSTNARLVLSPHRTTDNMRWVIQRQNYKFYVQNLRESGLEGIEYDTLEQAVVCAVALMELGG